MDMMKSEYPYYLANEPRKPNTDLTVTDKCSGEPAFRVARADAAAIDEAKKATEEGKKKTILFNYSGHGLMDLAGYQAYFADELENYPLPPEVMARSLAVMEGLPKPG